jgi:hypothetical protein
MADYSAMKYYLEKNNFHYFTFSQNSEKCIKAVIHHLPLDIPADDIFNSLDDLGFNIINVRQMAPTRRAPKGQTHMETLHLFLVTLTKNIKYQEVFKLNSLNDIIIMVEVCRAQTGPMQCHNFQNFGHVRANWR